MFDAEHVRNIFTIVRFFLTRMASVVHVLACRRPRYGDEDRLGNREGEAPAEPLSAPQVDEPVRGTRPKRVAMLRPSHCGSFRVPLS